MKQEARNFLLFFSLMIAFSRKQGHALPLMQTLLVFFIHAYRVIFTPIKVMFGLQECCRYVPSCSHYMEEAICTHGICRGVGLGTVRLLRCHPWGGMGLDPVPPRSF